MKNHTLTLKTNPENLIKQPLDEIVRLGARELLTTALEVEVNLFVERYQYIIDDQMRRQVVRHGHHRARKILTGAGQIEVEVPRVDDRVLDAQDEPRFVSKIVPPYLRKTKNMEELLPVLYLKGISTGDFREALEKILGKDVVGLSAQTIVRLKQVWQEEYAQWNKRDLSKAEYTYWWVDGIHCQVRLGDDKRVCILVIIGGTKSGKKEVVAVAEGYREDKESWASVLRDLTRRGLKCGPRLAVGDGALGFWSALADIEPNTRSQLCWVHKTANVLSKLPDSLHIKAKKMLNEIFMAPTKMDANAAFDVFIEEFDAKYPKAVDSLRNHRQELMEFYNYPAEHWCHLRSTNIVESPFATVRLRTNKTKGCGSVTATLTMVFKLLQSAEKRWISLRSKEKVEEVFNGIKFEDGVKIEEKQQVSEIVSREDR
jgi:transposase-like protein